MSRRIDADKLLEPVGSYDPKKYTWEYGMVVTVEDIKNAPTVDAEPKWIPVSERLPEEHSFVLVTINNTVDVAWRVGERWEDDTGTTISDSWYKTKVLAWMPLPEPYEVTE